jgi:hypothetical protein
MIASPAGIVRAHAHRRPKRLGLAASFAGATRRKAGRIAPAAASHVNHMSTVTRPRTTSRSSTMHVQSLIIELDGITAADYLSWVRDPEPHALDHGLLSVAICAEPLGALVYIELVWARRRPATPSAAAVAAGFALIPEVVAVLAGPAPADGHS